MIRGFVYLIALGCACNGALAHAQMRWMFGRSEGPLPVQQVDFDQLELFDESATLPAPIEPLPAVESLPAIDPLPPVESLPAVDPLPAGESLRSVESLPLQPQIAQWYRRPWLWVSSGWTNHVELGLNGSQGNSQTVSLTTGANLKRVTDEYQLGIDVDYVRTTSRGALTQNSGRFNVDYDRLLGDSHWSAFNKVGLEWDQFKVFDLRVNLNAGLGYHWIRSKQSQLVTRFGAGASREIGAPDDRWVPEALFGVDATHQLTDRQKVIAKIDYFPEWGDFANYRLVSDVAWEILLDTEENLSLKLAATDRYDSTPQGGARPNDLFYSLLLLYKF